MRVTLKDIAKELNISVNTVSRALRDLPDIAPATREQIKDTAARMGYEKNIAASMLRTNRAYVLGVVVTTYSNPAMVDIINGAEHAARQHGYTVMTGVTDEKPEEENLVISRMMARGVDGIILMPSLFNESVLQTMDDAGVPYVLAARRYPNRAANYVYCDDALGARLAAEYFFEHGHRSFLYVSGKKELPVSQERYRGFAGYLKEQGISAEAIQTVECSGNRADAYEKMKQYLSGLPKGEYPATAVFAFSDYVACGVLSALKQAGFRVPQDVSVIGCDNNQFADILDPPLTTVDNHFFQIGYEAAMRLIELTESQDKEKRETVTVPTLVERASVKALK